jgi:hypothetical protein
VSGRSALIGVAAVVAALVLAACGGSRADVAVVAATTTTPPAPATTTPLMTATTSWTPSVSRSVGAATLAPPSRSSAGNTAPSVAPAVRVAPRVTFDNYAPIEDPGALPADVWVQNQLGVAHGPKPTGTVTYHDAGSVLATVDLGPNAFGYPYGADATWYDRDVQPHVRTITATYNGDANYLPGSVTFTLGNPVAMEITAPPRVAVGQRFTVRAHVITSPGAATASGTVTIQTWVTPESTRVDPSGWATFTLTAPSVNPPAFSLRLDFAGTPANTGAQVTITFR